MPKSGQLIILSGPSGVGKSTVLKQVLEHFGRQLRLSVSATTRTPRAGEKDGVDYYFISKDEFARRREAGEFLECMEVFGRGHWYGTLHSEVRSSLDVGKWVILEIDVDGAEHALRHYPHAITIFLRPSSETVLEQRLRHRGTEQEEAIRRRLSVARRELARADGYDHQVVNDNIDEAVSEICRILNSRGLIKND